MTQSKNPAEVPCCLPAFLPDCLPACASLVVHGFLFRSDVCVKGEKNPLPVCLPARGKEGKKGWLFTYPSVCFEGINLAPIPPASQPSLSEETYRMSD